MYLKTLIQDQGLIFQMTSIPLTPKIFLTDDPGLIDSFTNPTRKTLPTSFTKFLDEYTKTEDYQEDNFLYMSLENYSILNFEYSLGGSSSKKDASKVVIEFMPTSEEFEFLLVKKLLNRTKSNNKYKNFPKLEFYLTFGIGDNLINWSPFLSVALETTATFQNLGEPKTIQLNFGIVNSVNRILDLFTEETSVNDSEPLASLNITVNNKFDFFTKSGFNIKNFLVDSFYGPKKDGRALDELRTCFAENDNTNSESIAKYLYGFNYLDAFYKKTLNDFFRSFFLEATNVFVVSESLPNLALESSPIYKFPGSLALNQDSPFLDSEQDPFGMSRSPAIREKLTLYHNCLLEIANILDDTLTTETQVPVRDTSLVRRGTAAGQAPGEHLNPLGSIRLEASFEPEQSSLLKSKKELFEEKVDSIIQGLVSLCGEEVDVIEESDVQTISDFYNNLRGGPWAGLSPDAKVPVEPIVLIGPRRLVRALLYGEIPKKDYLNSLLKLGTIIPTNEYAEKRAKELAKQKPKITTQAKTDQEVKSSRDDLTLLENILNHPTGKISEEDKKRLESSPFFSQTTESFKRAINEDYWPIFKFNTSDPNVISLKSENDYLLNQFLFLSFTDSSRFYSQFSVVENEAQRILNLQKQEARNRVVPKLLSYLGISDVAGFEEIKKELKLSLEESTKFLSDVKTVIKDQETDPLQLISYFIENNLIKLDTIDNFRINNLPYDQSSKDKIENLSDNTINMISTILTYLFKDQSFVNDYVESNLTYAKGSFGAVNLYSRLYSLIRKQQFTVEIETLPFFNISGPKYINLGCFLFANRVKVLGEKYNREDNIDKLYTGLYIITSIKHRISDSVCGTTLTLVKYPVEDL